MGVNMYIVGQIEGKEGFHVNFPHEVEELAAYRVKPKTPTAVYMGVETFFYVFDSEGDFYAAYPDGIPQVEETTGEEYGN